MKTFAVIFVVADVAFLCWLGYRGLNAIGHVLGFGTHVLFGGSPDTYTGSSKKRGKKP